MEACFNVYIFVIVIFVRFGFGVVIEATLVFAAVVIPSNSLLNVILVTFPVLNKGSETDT